MDQLSYADAGSIQSLLQRPIPPLPSLLLPDRFQCACPVLTEGRGSDKWAPLSVRRTTKKAETLLALEIGIDIDKYLSDIASSLISMPSACDICMGVLSVDKVGHV